MRHVCHLRSLVLYLCSHHDLILPQTKRFILLVDELYERGIELHCSSAAATPDALFTAFMTDPDESIGDCSSASMGAPVDAPTVRPVDESQLGLSIIDTSIINLRIASARAASRLVEVCIVALAVSTVCL